MENGAFVRYNREEIFLEDLYDVQQFKNIFKEMFPDEWKRIISTYDKEERKGVKGKGHPIP